MTDLTKNEDAVPTADVGWERRVGKVAGVCAILAAVATMAAVPVAASDVVQHSGDSNDLTLLRDIGNSGGGQVAAMVLRVAGIALLVPFAWFIFRATKGRNPQHSRYIPILGVVAFVIVGVSTVIGFYEVRDTAREFVASGPQTLKRAESMLDDARGGGLLRVANIAQVVGGLLFGIWISLTSLEAGRVGLLNRFLGIFGIGAGVSTAIGIPVGPALFLAWIGSLGLLAVGYWPGGRPPAWETGQATTYQETERIERLRRRGETA